ncbi:MAG: hypothetical protein ACJAUL_003078 [Paraglaciecola sp.]
MNRLFIVRYLPLFVIAALLFSAYFINRTEPTINSGVQCQLAGADECVLVVEQQKFVAQMLQQVEVEEELRVKLVFPAAYRLQKGWVQGINMYMGKTALMPQNSHSDGEVSTNELLFFLGACSEKKMQWQLVVIYLNPVSGTEHTLFYNFSTDTAT